MTSAISEDGSLLVTQAEFARIMGVNRSTVTAEWKNKGRLVMEGPLVDVEKSRALIAETANPSYAGAANAHAIERAAKAGTTVSTHSTIPPSSESELEEDAGISYQAARAVKEKYAALKARADYEQQIGNLIAREDVDAAMRFVGGAVRSLAEVLPDQLAPVLAPMHTAHEVHKCLTAAARDLLLRLGQAIETQRAALQKISN